MSSVLIAVFLSLFLGPGAGQLFNREFKKGFFLIGTSLFVFMGFIAWLVKVSIPYLPSVTTPPDVATLQKIVQDKVLVDHSGIFFTYELLLAALWVYGIVDAYLGAQQRLASKPTTQEEP